MDKNYKTQSMTISSIIYFLCIVTCMWWMTSRW